MREARVALVLMRGLRDTVFPCVDGRNDGGIIEGKSPKKQRERSFFRTARTSMFFSAETKIEMIHSEALKPK
jgi:hypothetical protein